MQMETSEVARKPAAASAPLVRYFPHNYELQACTHQWRGVSVSLLLLELNQTHKKNMSSLELCSSSIQTDSELKATGSTRAHLLVL